LRIGVNLGDVIVDGDDIFGDGVNIAARIEALAEPGTVCISQTVYDHVRNKLDLDYRSLGSHRVKNIAEPVRAYSVSVGPVRRAGKVPAQFVPQEFDFGLTLNRLGIGEIGDRVVTATDSLGSSAAR
jgi:hypothetical protein